MPKLSDNHTVNSLLLLNSVGHTTNAALYARFDVFQTWSKLINESGTISNIYMSQVSIRPAGLVLLITDFYLGFTLRLSHKYLAVVGPSLAQTKGISLVLRQRHVNETSLYGNVCFLPHLKTFSYSTYQTLWCLFCGLIINIMGTSRSSSSRFSIVLLIFV